MDFFEIPVKIFDSDMNHLGNGHLLSLTSGTIKVKGHNLPVLNANTKIYIEIYNEFHGIMPYFCTVSVAASNQLNAHILRIEPNKERRNSLKVRTDLSLYIEKLERNAEDITKDVPNMKINLLNLSIGGMLISSNYDLKINDVISFNFHYLTYQTIVLRAKVVRVDEIYDSITKEPAALNYGCIFKKLSSYDESVITKYLYNRQLKLYKNR